MAGFTQRFGFSRFGGNVGGGISDDGYKFSNRDRQIMDALLAALEAHDHSGSGASLGDPATGPALGVTTGGSLPAGAKVFYQVSFIDRFGLESMASPEVAAVTPAALPTPSAPALNTVGTLGGLGTGGSYVYVIATVVSSDPLLPTTTVVGSTDVSAPATVAVNSGESVALTLPSLPAVVPSITNLVTNPNADVSTANWTESSGDVTLTRTIEDAVLGISAFSLQHANLGAVGSYVYSRTASATVGQQTTASLYLRQIAGVSTLRLRLRGSGGQSSFVDITPTAQWTRYNVSYTPVAGDTYTELRLEFTNAGTADRVLFDAVQIEEGPLTPYADGNLGVGYDWTGTPGLSSSTRATGTGSAGYFVYRQGPGDTGLYQLKTAGGTPVYVTSATFTDDGSYLVDPTKTAPYNNSTSANNAIQVAVQGLPASATAWRIYRSLASGNYSTQSLVHEVSETTPATVNLIANPEAFTDLSGWAVHNSGGASGSLTRETSALPPVGAGASGKLTQTLDNARTSAIVQQSIANGLLLNGISYVLSVYVQWDGTGTNVPVTLSIATDTGANLMFAPVQFNLSSSWSRLVVPFTATADSAASSLVRLALVTPTVATGIRITGWQLEQQGAVTPYVQASRAATLNTTFLDVGGPLFDGAPLSISTALNPPTPVRGAVYSTAGRPSAAAVGAGGWYFDSTLHKPVWSDGATFRDAVGTVV